MQGTATDRRLQVGGLVWAGFDYNVGWGARGAFGAKMESAGAWSVDACLGSDSLTADRGGTGAKEASDGIVMRGHMTAASRGWSSGGRHEEPARHRSESVAGHDAGSAPKSLRVAWSGYAT